MYWTLELASKLEDAPWPATKDELIDYAMRSGAPLEVLENLQEIEDEGDVYESIEDLWPDYPTKEDFLFNEDEYKQLKQLSSIAQSIEYKRYRNCTTTFLYRFFLSFTAQ